MVSARGIEPPISCSRSTRFCLTKLRRDGAVVWTRTRDLRLGGAGAGPPPTAEWSGRWDLHPRSPPSKGGGLAAGLHPVNWRVRPVTLRPTQRDRLVCSLEHHGRVPRHGFEPWTGSLRGCCDSRFTIGALTGTGGRGRTSIERLSTACSRPLSYAGEVVGRCGIEPRPIRERFYRPRPEPSGLPTRELELSGGIEPPAYALPRRCTTIVLRQRNGGRRWHRTTYRRR